MDRGNKATLPRTQGSEEETERGGPGRRDAVEGGARTLHPRQGLGVPPDSRPPPPHPLYHEARQNPLPTRRGKKGRGRRERCRFPVVGLMTGARVRPSARAPPLSRSPPPGGGAAHSREAARAHAPDAGPCSDGGLLRGRNKSSKQRLSLSGSWQQGHSTTYSTPFLIQVVCKGSIEGGKEIVIAHGSRNLPLLVALPPR